MQYTIKLVQLKAGASKGLWRWECCRAGAERPAEKGPAVAKHVALMGAEDYAASLRQWGGQVIVARPPTAFALPRAK